MNVKLVIYILACMIVSAGIPVGFCASTGGDADVCDPQITGQIQKGRSSKADVKELIGEPHDIEASRDGGELWKYTNTVTARAGRAGGSSRGSGGFGPGGPGIDMRQTKCHLTVAFGSSGLVENVSAGKTSGASGFMK